MFCCGVFNFSWRKQFFAPVPNERENDSEKRERKKKEREEKEIEIKIERLENLDSYRF